MDRELIVQIHTIAGILVFLSGLLQILLKKGGKRHIIIGQLYMLSWLVVLVSGAKLGSLLIAIVGLFGFYFALTGARIGRVKNGALNLFDKLIFILGGLMSLAMIYYAIVLFMRGSTSFAIIFAVFGLLFLLTTVKDIFKFVLQKPLEDKGYGKLDWYFEHLFRMSISFIAALTAFASIQNLFRNNTLNFLLPTLIGTVLINVAVKKYKRKLIK